jgi:hypothetical protein
MHEIEFKKQDIGHHISRFKVIGGWLIINMVTGHMQFIKDNEHQWKIKEPTCAQ